ncbi:MAG: hypothetical protein EAZ76_16235 [Nostocales cyanobacterium]|nr:MAG: hypothetical protein EAZ87_22725 [Nostocales cyanobacterium]TAF09372.1 MAG: hypothetical protein EAZ76_16235 [Nostocales cyanobacterium]
MKKNVVKIVIRLSVTIITVGLITTINSLADAQETTPILADITIDNKFKPDPLVIRGMSGSSVPASQVNGGNKTQTGTCSGFVDKDPNHNLKLLNKFDYLKIQVESPADTTIMIKGPGGTWCNDDLDGKNPGIVGEWLKGSYKIWVGSYEKGKSLPYTLKITEAK